MKESFEWILRAVESSTNGFHLQCCHTLTALFYKRYGPPNGGNDEFDKNFVELQTAMSEQESKWAVTV